MVLVSGCFVVCFSWTCLSFFKRKIMLRLSGNRLMAVGAGQLAAPSTSLAIPASSSSSLVARNNSTKVKRPISPHLTIYRLPLCANLSFITRATGLGMTVGMFFFSFFSFFFLFFFFPSLFFTLSPSPLFFFLIKPQSSPPPFFSLSSLFFLPSLLPSGLTAIGLSALSNPDITPFFEYLRV